MGLQYFLCQIIFTLDRLVTKNHLISTKCHLKFIGVAHFEIEIENTSWPLQNWTITKKLQLKFGF